MGVWMAGDDGISRWAVLRDRGITCEIICRETGSVPRRQVAGSCGRNSSAAFGIEVDTGGQPNLEELESLPWGQRCFVVDSGKIQVAVGLQIFRGIHLDMTFYTIGRFGI